MWSLSTLSAVSGTSVGSCGQRRETSDLDLHDIVLPSALRIRNDPLGPVREELVDGLPCPRPARIVVFVEHDDSALDDLVVERLERDLVRLIEIAIEMQQRDLSLIGRQRLVEETFDEPHTVANDPVGHAAFAKDPQHDFRRSRPEIFPGDRRRPVQRARFRETLERVETVVRALDAEILAQQQEEERAVAYRYAALDDVALDVADLFELTQKVQAPLEDAARDTRQKRRVVVLDGDRVFERVPAHDLEPDRRGSRLDKVLEHEISLRESLYILRSARRLSVPQYCEFHRAGQPTAVGAAARQV